MATTKAPRKKKEQIKRPDLKIGIKDFGPIAEGEIELKPLTVFIGPNNSGKSYAAMLIQSIFDLYKLSQHDPPLIFSYSSDDSTIDELKIILENLAIGESINISPEIIQNVINWILKEMYEGILSNQITRLYACKLDDLAMIEKDYFSLDVNFNSYRVQMQCKEGLLKISEYPKKKDWNIDIIVTKKSNQGTKKKMVDGDISISINGKQIDYVTQRWKDLRIDKRTYILLDLHYEIIQLCHSKILGNMIMSCKYLPSARSDKLQFYKLIAGNVLKQATSFDKEKQQAIPKLLGVVSDFISSIIEISPEKKGYYYEFAVELEKELLKGNIVFESADANLLPEVKYRFQGVDIPLQRASSSVTEIAPLILYLKYIVEPGSVLIIEEPEAHLHPGNQRILAKYLVRLIRQGVNVLITTHSDYLLEQINNFYLLSKKTPEERVENYKYDENDFIKSDELGIYEFYYDEEAKGYKIKQTEIDEDGILEREIYNTTEALYDETSQLQREFDDEE